jgi:lipopolysaccharide transport system ATP-binding protein
MAPPLLILDGIRLTFGGTPLLDGASLSASAGEKIALVGRNGSGKSTLLKILSGAMYPTEGTFEVSGRVLSLLELGTGVNPQLTGRQNVINSARLLAFPPGYVAGKMGEIEAFAELGEFFERPVRLYSSGMLVRLVFSMFACFEPDVFVVDEALSVGDLYFQQKCARRIEGMIRSGVTILFVSHDLAAVEALCDRVMVLHGGRVRFLGGKREGISTYYSLVGATKVESGARELRGAVTDASREPSASAAGHAEHQTASSLSRDEFENLPWQPPDLTDRLGDGRVDVTGICYRIADGTHTQCLERGEWIDVFVRYEARAEAGPVNCGIEVHDRFGHLLFAVNWVSAEVEPVSVRAGDVFYSRFRLKADLEPGEYALWLGASQANRDPQNPTGWDQNTGGPRYVGLPRAGKIAVLPRADRRRSSYGPANLAYRVDRTAPEPLNPAP